VLHRASLHRLVATLLVLAVAAGCASDDAPGAADGAAPPTSTTTTSEPSADPLVGPDGRPRTWELHVPDDLGDDPVPLVVALHGAGASGAALRATSGYDDLADDEGVVVVYPDAIGVVPTWNAGECCPPASIVGTDDVAFVEALVDRLVGELAIDPDRVHVTGHSNGAMLTHRLACESDRFAGAVAVAGSLEAACAEAPPVSVLQIHGTADPVVPFDDTTDGVFGLEFTPAPESFERWSSLQGCDPDAVVEVDGRVTTSTSTGCRGDVVVQLRAIEGWDHAWPGRDAPLDATAAGWEFLSARER
jgi:polyhydroxybutyrate depolymerase